jgi:hypothetical protein
MNQRLIIVTAVSLILAGFAASLLILSGQESHAQPVPPTPKGQLGGPIPLTTAEAPVAATPTPAPSPTPTPASSPVAREGDIPPPADCRIAPRTITELQGLTTMNAMTGTPGPPNPDLDGEPADDATISGVTATVWELLACTNAGDLLRGYALFTDDYLRRIADTIPLDTLDDGIGSVPRPPEHWERLHDIDEIRLIADGKVSALVMFGERGSPLPPSAFQFVFVRSGERWLIDEIMPGAGDR